MSHIIADSIGRRSRLGTSPTGKRVSPTTRDLRWFEALAQHGPLPTSFLLAFTKDSHASEKRARERLTDLFHEDNTPDDGPYLVRPPQQFRTIDARYNQLVHCLAPAGRRALARHGMSNDQCVSPSGPWLHGLMTSCITASIELATLGRPDIAYIPQSRILARADTALRCPVRICDPSTGNMSVKTLAPDAVFGLEYKTGACSRFRFFAVEADRATEPITSANWNRKSFERNLLQYRAYVEGGEYRRHLKLTSPLIVLHVTTSALHCDQMLALLRRRYPASEAYVLFRPWDAFATPFHPPEPVQSLLDAPWQGGFEHGFRIDRVCGNGN